MIDDPNTQQIPAKLTPAQEQHRADALTKVVRAAALSPFTCAEILAASTKGLSIGKIGSMFTVRDYLVAAVIRKLGDAATNKRLYAKIEYQYALTRMQPQDEQELRARIIESLPTQAQIGQHQAAVDRGKAERDQYLAALRAKTPTPTAGEPQ